MKTHTVVLKKVLIFLSLIHIIPLFVNEKIYVFFMGFTPNLRDSKVLNLPINLFVDIKLLSKEKYLFVIFNLETELQIFLIIFNIIK